MSAEKGPCEVVYSLAREQDSQQRFCSQYKSTQSSESDSEAWTALLTCVFVLQILNICSPQDYNGLDYLPSFFHRWMQEPGRLVFISRIEDRVVALESVLIVDGGQTALFQARRVVSDLRGSGLAGDIHKYATDYLRRHFPEVTAVRLCRGDKLTPQTLAKYRVIAKEAILSVCCESANLSDFINELRSRLPPASFSGGPIILNQQQAETLILSDHVVSNLLPGKTIIDDWEPLKPIEANLEVLRRKALTWIVDREHEAAALSLGTPPYAVPYRDDALRLIINIFGCSLAAVCTVYVAQLEALLPRPKGFLIIQSYVNPVVYPGLRHFCQNSSKVSFDFEYYEDVVLERDL
ncbi:histidine N-acetyltransferase-like [Pholidichthys leucotaenia]